MIDKSFVYIQWTASLPNAQWTNKSYVGIAYIRYTWSPDLNTDGDTHTRTYPHTPMKQYNKSEKMQRYNWLPVWIRKNTNQNVCAERSLNSWCWIIHWFNLCVFGMDNNLTTITKIFQFIPKPVKLSTLLCELWNPYGEYALGWIGIGRYTPGVRSYLPYTVFVDFILCNQKFKLSPKSIWLACIVDTKEKQRNWWVK